MHETTVCITGNVVNDPKLRQLSTNTEVLSFRLASSTRRYDKQSQQWLDGAHLFVTATCWGKLASRAHQCIQKGKTVMVFGALRTVEYHDTQGQVQSNLELRVYEIGLSLRWNKAYYAHDGQPSLANDPVKDDYESPFEHKDQEQIHELPEEIISLLNEGSVSKGVATRKGKQTTKDTKDTVKLSAA